MKNEKRQELSAKLLGQMMVENFSHQIASFLFTAEKAGISKDDAENLATELFAATLKKVSKKPGRYSDHHGGGHYSKK